MISSASITVDSRCAIIKVVRPIDTSRNARWISRSVWVSSALVASSNKRIAGPFRMVRAMAWATLSALRRSSFLHLTLEFDGTSHAGRAPFVFIGNNDYVMEGFDIGKRSSLRDGRLSVYTTRRRTRFGLVALALRALVGRLRQADDFLAESVSRLRVESRHSHLHVATDGEVTKMATPLDIRSLPGALRVIGPVGPA